MYRTGLRQIHELRGLSRHMPVAAFVFTACAFSMIGIPPTGGFFSKLYLMLGAIEAGNWVFVGVIVISSLLALAYLANVLRYLYFPRDEDGGEDEAAATPIPPRRHTAPWTMLGPMVAVTAVILLLGLFNGEVVDRFIVPALPAGLAAGGVAP